MRNRWEKRLFYISRRNGVRPALNEDAILAGIKSWGITVVAAGPAGRCSEQIELFLTRQADHGTAGRGNPEYALGATWLPCAFEFISPRYFSGVYWTLTESLGQSYGLVTGETSVGGKSGRLSAPHSVPSLINRALDQVLLR